MPAPSYLEIVAATGVLTSLAAFDPRIAGTYPLGLQVAGSDIDVLCHAKDLEDFRQTLEAQLWRREGFSLRCRTGAPPAIVCNFQEFGWRFEIFGQDCPVERQLGWRHMLVERDLLEAGGETLRKAVMHRRLMGMKTEPAFADVLSLKGDPYEALLTLEGKSAEELHQIVLALGLAR